VPFEQSSDKRESGVPDISQVRKPSQESEGTQTNRKEFVDNGGADSDGLHAGRRVCKKVGVVGGCRAF
jgi:hypothetical protein